MPVISGSHINNLLSLFEERDVRFYHSCQYKDFKTYLRLGGVPSRHILEKLGLPYTQFDTDARDKGNSVWDKVFGNLQDFGVGFANFQMSQNTAPLPNPYGPILLIFKPEVLLEARDVAICLRSAGALNFDRDIESLGTLAEVNKIFTFENVQFAETEWDKSRIKWSLDLQRTFNNSLAMSPEVSCTLDCGRFSFQHLEKIIVDPYVVKGVELVEKVWMAGRLNFPAAKVWGRLYKRGENRLEIKQELANLLLENVPSLSEIRVNSQLSSNLRDYASRLERGDMNFFYDRFARYLRGGTLLELQAEA